MDKYDIAPHVRWETEVTEAAWDDADATWTVLARDRDGETTELSARAVISAVGQLDRPYVPASTGSMTSPGWRSIPASGTIRWICATRRSR